MNHFGGPTMTDVNQPSGHAPQGPGGPDPHQRHEAHHHDVFHPVLWPIREKGEWRRTWWLLLADYIPIVNLILLRGWRLALVGRIARGERPMAPPASGVLSFFVNGLLLWCMTALYALVPLVIIAKLGLGGFGDLMRDIVECLRILLGQSSQSLGDFVVNELVDSFLAAAIELMWIPISAPLYRAAMIRYAVTGNIAAFANLPATIAFLARYPWSFTKLYLYSFVLGIIVAIVGGVLTLTGIGALIVPIVTFPMYYWATGFEYGELASQLARDRAKRGIVATPPSIGAQTLGAAAAALLVGFMAVRSVVLMALGAKEGVTQAVATASMGPMWGSDPTKKTKAANTREAKEEARDDSNADETAPNRE